MQTDKEKKQRFLESVGELKKEIDKIQQKIKTLDESKENSPEINKIKAASYYLDLVSVYCAMTDLSQTLLGYKNESYLDQARKSLYKAIILLEGVVSNIIDMPFSENSERLEKLEQLSDADRLKLANKIGYTISLLEDRYGEKSKWKWSFVELLGRYATIVKNMFDFRAYQAMNDPSIEGFDERYDLLVLIKELLLDASNKYREKYELTNHNPDDMKKAIDSLRALKRIHILLNEKNEIQSITKRIELWSQKLEADMKAKEMMLKKKAAQKYSEKK